MTAFLIILIAALIAVSAWQISKIVSLGKASSGSNGAEAQIANDEDNKRNGQFMLYFGIGIYIMMIACFIAYDDFFLPDAASEHGTEYDSLLFTSTIIIMIVQVLTQGLLHYFSYKYHGKKGQKALFYADNDRLEFIWTAIPVVVLAGLILWGLFSWNDIMDANMDDDPIVVEVYAYQFGWKARYSGADNTLGDANVRFIEGANQLGVDPTDADGQDDVVTTELHLPVDRPVLFKFRSQDVLHSAYFPHFRAQMNVVPGMVTQFKFTPTVTSEEYKSTEFMTEKVSKINEIRRQRSKELEANGDVALDPYEFEYYLLCNKICGASHYNMQMKIVVEEKEDFDAWIAEQKTIGTTLANAEN
ncbi:cytochrome c oxidase polypeptide II [Nonlabens tegetincola]|uniref:cytochrome-c oxidase n=1 Tax=Nonlabens tegetincola TaxID=323273 RepID=A0A090Q683_9FLAO|nr:MULTISPECIES: cytochrome c oxidase subunit II [Nonlabens]ALM21322.1 cytochrome C oxidase subunit II [Nonlabens sp. MIC269]PQJ20425.1 cytochrome C oxidase subunit II [Nonlabens tegetincola]GAK97722.1 cytochrome c oxidase polypeptide II [Nonlabens tegetincola]